MNHTIARIIYLFGSLLAVVSLACLGSVSGGRGENAPQSAPAQSTAPAQAASLQVDAHEFTFALDRSSASPGEITFVVRNTGQMPHDFAIHGPGVDAKTPLLNPGESAELIVTLRAGSYNYVCTVPGHVQLGMTGTFKVSPSD